MTKDDIIRLAREAGFADGLAEILGLQAFANFASLVSAHAMAQPCCGKFATCQRLCMPKGAAVERETIAQMFDAIPELVTFARRGDGGCIMCGFSKSHAAEAIRARSNHDQL